MNVPLDLCLVANLLVIRIVSRDLLAGSHLLSENDIRHLVAATVSMDLDFVTVLLTGLLLCASTCRGKLNSASTTIWTTHDNRPNADNLYS